MTAFTYTYTANGSHYFFNSGTAVIKLRGPGGNGAALGGGGGGGGGYSEKTVTIVAAGSKSFTVNAGADATFDTNVVVAKKGANGSGSSGGAGGAAASGVGTTKWSGGNGGNSDTTCGGGGGSGADSTGDGGNGNDGVDPSGGDRGTAALDGGSGGDGGASGVNGNNGVSPGGGGGGGGDLSGTGGTGARGEITIIFTPATVSIDSELDTQNIITLTAAGLDPALTYEDSVASITVANAGQRIIWFDLAVANNSSATTLVFKGATSNNVLFTIAGGMGVSQSIIAKMDIENKEHPDEGIKITGGAPFVYFTGRVITEDI